MTTPTTPREPLDLEALERRTARMERLGVPTVVVDQHDFDALLARIRELEAERPDWSDEQIDTFRDNAHLGPWSREGVRSALRAAGIVPNVARWRPISEAPKDGKPVLVGLRGAVPIAAEWDGQRWYAPGLGTVRPTHFQPLPAPPTTETT